MRMDSISFNNKISAAKINTTYKKVSNNFLENLGDVLKPLEIDTISFEGKKQGKQRKNEVKKAKNTGKIPAFLHSFLLNKGQKRASKLENQARKIMEDAQDALGFSYVGKQFLHSRQTITDGMETNNGKRVTNQVYKYTDGELVKAELERTENLTTGEKSIKQIFEFEGGKLSSVYENYTKHQDGTVDFQRKFMADEKGHLHCVYNKVL